MKLTGKLKQDFGNQCVYQYDEFIKLPQSFQNALIIEYLDSVGIYIDSGYYDKNTFCSGINRKKDIFISVGTSFKTRTEAINAAIEKANEIINKI
jgi:hypothetical protein